LYFHKNKIVTIGQELLRSWNGIDEPIWVRHKIGSAVRGNGELKFFANDIQILEPAEPSIDEIFLNATELSIDVPEPVAPPESKSVLSSETKNVSIIELIRRRRKQEKKS
jgi:hypothetical protein